MRKAQQRLIGLLVALVAIPVFGVTIAAAAPLPGEVLKFQQLPMTKTSIGGIDYFGHDELSTAKGSRPQGIYSGIFMADDFAGASTDPVVHVRWWGSYLDNASGFAGVQEFLIAFEKDVPAGDPLNTLPFSHPGDLLRAQTVVKGPLAPGSGTFTETLVPGSSPTEPVFEYNAELKVPFDQDPDTVYWLKIVALVDEFFDGSPINWGWHNRDYTVRDLLASVPPGVTPGEANQGPDGPIANIWHFQDNAVSGDIGLQVVTMTNVLMEQENFDDQFYLGAIDGPLAISDHSKDLAFELYTQGTAVPEPSSLVLLGTGACGIVTYLRYSRRKVAA